MQLNHLCDEHDHRLATYAAEDRALLERVEAFNRSLVEAMDAGRDVAAVFEALDPDPARYTWVDEGERAIASVLSQAESLLDRAPPLEGHRLLSSVALGSRLPASRPAVSTAPDGTAVVAWIEWSENEGEQVVAVRTDAAGQPLAEPLTIPAPPADCLRPSVVFDGDGVAHVFFGLRRPSSLEVCVVSSQLGPSGWSAPEPISHTGHPSFNQEVVRHANGSLECCWQGWGGGGFGVYSSRQLGAWRWSDAELLNGFDPAEANAWDPVLAPFGDGRTAYAWTSYGAGGYQTVAVVREPGGSNGRRRDQRFRIESAGGYSLHPSLAVTADGRLFCADDQITIGGHAGSGPTRLVRRELLGSERPSGVRPDGVAVPGDLSPNVVAKVRVMRLGDTGFETTGDVGRAVKISPSGLPRLATTEGGRLVVTYRCIRQLPLMLYYWQVVAESLGPAGWEGFSTFQAADGPLEEAAPAASSQALLIAWQEDGRRDQALTWTEGFGGEECTPLREHYGEVIWHSVHRGGRIRLGLLPRPAAAGASAPSGPPATGAVVTERAHEQSPPADARPWATARAGRNAERYVTSLGGEPYSLYWGDLHRHSLISRCTAGDEPALDDLYRYSLDVCEYDFWAVTDHAENTSAYQWASIQKFADVLHIPGSFVPFYGFEWTSATGHQNVIYSSALRGAPIYSSTAAETSTPPQLWAGLRRSGLAAITIPHHPGSAMVPFDWSFHDEEMVRLVEIFQACRGNYEADGCFRQYSDATVTGTFATDGLRAGHRFGFIGSSDHGNGASYVGAFAAGLTREDVFEALHARRTIAATTRDIVVDVRLNGCVMGSVAPAASTARFELVAAAYTDLARVEIVRNGSVVRRWAQEPPVPAGCIALPLRVEWTVGSAPVTDWSGALTITGGEIVESDFWSPAVTHVKSDRVEWSARTRNFRSQYGAQRGGVELTVLGGPDTELTVTTSALSGTARLGDLHPAGRVELGFDPDAGELRLQLGTGALVSLGTTEASVEHAEAVTEASWYYARVTLVDGEMAWSSPIWVTPAEGQQ